MATPTYWDYLQLDQLLTLQEGLEGNGDVAMDDELHFIIVHQTYELWFKLALRGIRRATEVLSRPRVDEAIIPGVVEQLRRITAILKLAVQQFEVMETLTPQGFLAFRDKLVPSSGFQSFQMREMEILLGLEDSQRIRYGKVDPLDHIKQLAERSPAGALAWGRIEHARGERTLLIALEDWLYRTPIQGSTPDQPGDEAVVLGFLDAYLDKVNANIDAHLEDMLARLDAKDEEGLRARYAAIVDNSKSFLHADDVLPEARNRIRRVRAAVLFIESYRALPLLAWPRLLLDQVVELEEQLVLFRHRHARMVERIIGRRPGTGGSGGVDYLDKTGKYRVFGDLWAIRTVLLPTASLPELGNPEFYGFMADE